MKKIIIIIALILIVVAVSYKFCKDNSNIVLNQNNNNVENNKTNISEIENVKVTLTQSELEEFTEYFRKSENNGFIVTNYKNIEDIDLVQVLYAGAGISIKPSYNEVKEVDSDMAEFGIPVLKFETKKVNQFLKRKTGKEFDLKNKLDMIYSSKYDAYYFSAGDTNYDYVTCIEGYKQGNIYVINGDYSSIRYINESTETEHFTVTLEKNKDNEYIFISNIMK